MVCTRLDNQSISFTIMSKYNNKVPPKVIADMFSGLNDFMKKYSIPQINMGSNAIVRTKGKFAKPVNKIRTKKKDN